MPAAIIPIAIAAAPVVAAGIGVYQGVQSIQQSQSAQKQAKKQAAAQAQRELEAGEYWEELNKKQMELQAQTSQMNLLANIIANQERPQSPVLQLPAAKTYTYTAIERINQAIDDFFKGR